MTEQKNNTSNEIDLGLPECATMHYNQLTKPEHLEKIANDDRHVRILIYRTLCENIDAIRKFSRSSTLLSCAILVLVIVQIVLIIVQVFLALR